MTARARDDGGSVTPFVVVITMALLLCAGLVYDGGRTMAARREAAGLALAAARRGAQELDVNGDRVVIDEADAVAAAEAFVDAAVLDHDQTLVARRAVGAVDTVTVTVEISQPTFLLGLVGIHSSTVRAVRTARPVPGP